MWIDPTRNHDPEGCVLMTEIEVDMPEITNIRFIPRPFNSDLDENCLGFVTFTYRGEIGFKSVSVYKILNKNRYRFVYPFDKRFRRTYAHPVNAEIGTWIEEQLNNYLIDYFKKSVDKKK